jgi:hypothetical protein
VNPPAPDFGSPCIAIELARKVVGTGCGPFGMQQVGMPPDDTLIADGVGPGRSVSVRLRFADRSTLVIPTPRRAWVAEIGPERRRYGHQPTTLEYLGKSGRVVATYSFGKTPPPSIRSGQWRTVAVFGGRPLRVAPASDGGTCIDFRRADGIGIHPRAQQRWLPGGINHDPACSRPIDQVSGWLLRIGPREEGGRLILFGRMPIGATSVEARLGHRVLRATLHDGLYVLALPKRPIGQLANVTARGSGGRVLDTLRIDLPARGVFTPAWHGALYALVWLDHGYQRGYGVGPLLWPDGHVTGR